MARRPQKPSAFRWRRVRAFFRLLKWIFWTERKKRIFYKRRKSYGTLDWDPKKRRMVERRMGSLMVFDPKQQHQLPGKLPPPDEGWKPLKDMFYELGLIGALFVVYLGVTKHPEYFFPFWVPEFPARTELLEVSGELRFHRGPSRGGSRYVTISLDRYGLKK